MAVCKSRSDIFRQYASTERMVTAIHNFSIYKHVQVSGRVTIIQQSNHFALDWLTKGLCY